MITIEIPMHLPSMANLNWHWRRKYNIKKNHKNLVHLYLTPYSHDLRNQKYYHVHIVRSSIRALDEDNLVAACKHLVDAIADFIKPGLAPGRADGLECFSFSYAQEKSKISHVKIIISMC